MCRAKPYMFVFTAFLKHILSTLGSYSIYYSFIFIIWQWDILILIWWIHKRFSYIFFYLSFTIYKES